MTDLIFNRRNMFKSLLAISAVGATAACSGAQAPADTDVTDVPPSADFFNAQDMALVSAIADTIIPATETAGAVGAGVPETLQALATEWGDDAFRQYWRAGFDSLAGQLGEDFAAADPAARLARLQAYDAEVFDGVTEDGFYRDFKATIVQAYYMSEPGASEELAYEPVPGEWIGCVPLSDFPKTWAT